MPVFNGETHLSAAVESLLAQSFTDFELLISDNASTDNTGEICRAFVALDPRVRYFRQPRNLGATDNWNFVALNASGEFFKWASANDICPPLMLRQSFDTLNSSPTIVLAYGRTVLIDDGGRITGEHNGDPEILDEQPSVRFVRLLNELVWNNAQSGLIRASALRRTRLVRPYIDGDMVLMAELVLLGGFRKLDDVLLYRRVDRGSATRFMSDADRQNFLRPNSADRTSPILARHADRFLSVCRSPIPWHEKSRALDYVLRSAYWDRANIARSALGLIRPKSGLK